MFVVTGGGRGIGRALALALAYRKKHVLIVGRQEADLKAVAQCSSLIRYVSADVSASEGREKIIAALQHVSQVDGLIHNAGLIEPIAPLRAVSVSSFQQIMATNLEAPLFLNQSLYDKLETGRVLHIGTAVAYFPVVGLSLYCISKAALSMLTRCWQLEFPERLCASVMPGIIDTDMQEKIRHSEAIDPEQLKFYKRLYDIEGLISVDTVALFLCWLLLDITSTRYVSKEWDIYDTSDHAEWLVPPHRVPPLESL